MTFTDAAGEMKHRRRLLGRPQLQASTFHAAASAARLLVATNPHGPPPEVLESKVGIIGL